MQLGDSNSGLGKAIAAGIAADLSLAFGTWLFGRLTIVGDFVASYPFETVVFCALLLAMGMFFGWQLKTILLYCSGIQTGGMADLLAKRRTSRDANRFKFGTAPKGKGMARALYESSGHQAPIETEYIPLLSECRRGRFGLFDIEYHNDTIAIIHLREWAVSLFDSRSDILQSIPPCEVEAAKEFLNICWNYSNGSAMYELGYPVEDVNDSACLKE